MEQLFPHLLLGVEFQWIKNRKLEFSVLGSGSKGNAYLVKDGDTILLIDVGFTYRELSKRLEKISIDIEKISGILLTHEHQDHIKGLKILLKKIQIPLYLTSGTLNSIPFDLKTKIEVIKGGEDFQIGSILISPFSIMHDAKEPISFSFSNGRKKIGFASDLGKVTLLVLEKLKGSNLLAIEANHDENLLINGPYHYRLKERIKSTYGHLSNKDAAEAIKSLLTPHLKYILPIHLSEINNEPNLVKYYVEEILRIYSMDKVSCIISSQKEVIPFLEV